MILKSINPYSGKTIKEAEEFSEKQVDDAITAATDTFETWRKIPFAERGALMKKVATRLRSYMNRYALAITAEMGKPVKESRSEIEKCAWVCDYYAENAERFLMSETVATDADLSFVQYEPLGIILGIMPWNFPFWQVFRFAVPTLMAGNGVLLKHSSNVQLCAQHIEEVFIHAGFPGPIFRNLAIGSSKVERIIRDERVRGVSLTGSESAGKNVSAIAGAGLKKTVLELGGSNAFVVLEDADIRKAAETAVQARFQNAGQSCIAAKRFIIHRNIRDRFMQLFLERINNLKAGDPAEESTDIGPLSGVRQAEIVEDQVRRSVREGARIITGGVRQKAFFQPTVVADVMPGMSLFDEEVFGPVAPVMIADSTREAVELAGRTTFGLGVSLFTGDMGKARELAHEFRDGAVFVNGLVKSDPRLPFGGTGHSGYGRELALHGIREFVNVKTIWIKNT